MKNNKFTKTLSISLLLTVFSLPNVAAAGLVDADVERIGARIFHYTDPTTQPTRQVVFSIADGIKDAHSFAWEFLTGFYQAYNRKGNYAVPFSDNLTECMRDQRIKVEACLQKAPELDAAKTLLLFDGMCRRIFSLYQPFFASIDKLNKEFQGEPISADFSKGRYASFPGDFGTINLTRGKEAAQCALFQDLSNLQSEIRLAKALVPGVDKLDNFQLLLYITGVAQISLGNKFHVVNPAISGLYSAYGNPALGLAAISALEQIAAHHLRIVDVDIPGKVRFSILPGKDDWCEIGLEKQDGIQLTKEKIIGGDAKVAPAPKFILMFTKEDDAMLAKITDTDTRIQASLKETGRTPAGYTVKEMIMDYGTVADKSLITQQMRLDVPALLNAQLARRGMTPPPVENAVDVLKIWIKELGIFPNTAVMEQSLEYTQRQAFQSPENARLLESLWMLRHVHGKYKNWQNVEQKAAFSDGMLPVLTQSLIHLEDHNGRCVTGARGRTFLIELGTLNFFRNIHPNLEIAA
jgi:hypothetical protein